MRKRLGYGILLAAGVAMCGWIAAAGYRLNLPFFFYDGLVGAFVLLLLARRLGSGLVIGNILNTILLLIPGLILVDAAIALRQPDPLQLPTKARAYSFEVARGDPAQFRNWWKYFMKEWARLFKELKMPDPEDELPFRLKPNSEVTFFNSRIAINSLGVRDREIDPEKAGVYRIVALGESTTMGVTIEESDRPWPTVLEELVHRELHCDRPVQVVNAGVAAYNLEHTLVRLRRLLPQLRPDLLISYHGYNGFPFLQESGAGLRELPPVFQSRPSILLARLEHRIRLLRFRHRNLQPSLPPQILAQWRANALQSEYAAFYRSLIDIAQERNVPLLLVRFNMAVNRASSDELIDFYSAGFPSVMFDMLTCEAHNDLIQALAEENEGAHFIDASQQLDGFHERYIDLIHFSQEGRQQLAENILDGLKPVLEADPSLRCRGQLPAKDRTSD